MAEGTESQHQLIRVATVARRQVWLIALITVLTLLAAVAVVTLQSTVYRASMKIVVGQGNGLFQPQFGGSVEPFTRTMTSLLESEVVARGVVRRLRLDTTPRALLDQLAVVTTPESSVLEVQYDTTRRGEAVPVLSAVGAEFRRLVQARLNNPRGVDAGAPITATIFDPATLADEPVAPQATRTYFIAIVLGLILGFTFAFIRDGLDRKIRSPADAELAYRAPVLGVMPRQPRKVRSFGLDVDSHVMHMLGANVQFLREGGYGPSFVVTSALADEGKTTVVASLAAALAAGGKRVVCVDADRHRSKLGAYLGAKPSGRGLAEVIRGVIPLESALQKVYVRPIGGAPRGPGRVDSSHAADSGTEVFLLTPGSANRDPTTYKPDSVADLMERLHETFDYVVVDTPPVLLAADAFPFVQSADTVVVVAREGKTNRDSAESASATLARLGVIDPVVILTDSMTATEQYGYGRAYRGGFGEESRELVR